MLRKDHVVRPAFDPFGSNAIRRKIVVAFLTMDCQISGVPNAKPNRALGSALFGFEVDA